MKEIVLATHNDHKAGEIRAILSGVPVRILTLKDIGWTQEIEENGATFEENALIKARTIHEATGRAVLADDSGLEIDAFDGGPGVYSSRFLGEDTPHSVKNPVILERMKDLPDERRGADFRCVMAFITEEGEEHVAEGRLDGRIAYESAGCGGFGYDPIFYLPERGVTNAELTPEEKNAISHRGRAARNIQPFIEAWILGKEKRMKIDPRFLSYYYEGLTEYPPITLESEKTALLLIDMQKEFILRDDGEAIRFKADGTWEHWLPFHDRLDEVTIPACVQLLTYFREHGLTVTFGRIASLKKDGADRCPIQKQPGWNDILLPVNSPMAQMIDELAPAEDEIVVNKTTDSVVAGTNYAKLLRNMGIDTVIVGGIVTDQCVASTVRGLADEGFRVLCVEDACAAASMDQHIAELKIMNCLYCSVLSLDQTMELLETCRQ